MAITRHCNLRCPHCIRDDVQSVKEVSLELFDSVLEQSTSLFSDVVVSLTGGEPLVHSRFDDLIDRLRSRQLPWRLVSNGWHVARALPTMTRHAPEYVRLSLSGGSREIHDAERGRGSFDRVLLGIGLLRSRGIPAGLTLVVDRRDRHQLHRTVDLAESLGAAFVQFILPQPVPGSAARGSDLAPEEWPAVRREVESLAAASGRATRVLLAYGAPSLGGPEPLCATKRLQRLTVDVEGRVALCCQLSEYGGNTEEVVADLHEVPLSEAWRLYRSAMASLRRDTRPAPSADDPFGSFPCIRCARLLGKTAWLARFPNHPWAGAAGQDSRSLPVLQGVPA